MTGNEFDQYLTIIKTVQLNSTVKINKWSENFMIEVLLPNGLIAFVTQLAAKFFRGKDFLMLVSKNIVTIQ